MTDSPPSSALDVTTLSREQAAAAFDPHLAPREWLNDKARLAILSPTGRIVSASPAMLTLFGAEDCEALEARLTRGGGPTPRRLRHLAETLPIGDPRLEPLRIAVGRRSVGVNARCVRVGGPGTASWLLISAPALGAESAPSASAAEPAGKRPRDSSTPELATPPRQNSRFLWTLDEEGRFGAPHPTLAAAVGTNAPHRGESVEALLRRAGLIGGDALAQAISERRTFSDVAIDWPVSGVGRRRFIALSAAPLFGRLREFLGYRGFGVLGQERDALFMDERAPSAQALDDQQSTPSELLDPKRPSPGDPLEFDVQADKSAGEPIEPAPTSSDQAARPSERVPEARGSSPTLAPAEALEPPLSYDLGLWAQADAGVAATPEAERSESVAASSDAFELARAPLDRLELETGAPETRASPAAPLDVDEAKASAPESGARPESGASAAERTAAIYVLRHSAPAIPSNIVPIRPGALDALAREAAQSFPAESVELSRSERDAFREIARALVGRAPIPRDDHPDERSSGDALRPIGAEPRTEHRPDLEDGIDAAFGADSEQVQRNAGAVLDRLPIGVLIARDGQPLYANRMLLDLIGYRSFAEFQKANGLAGMFRDHDPQAMAAEDVGAVAIVKANGQILSVDGHAQVISWEGAPATLIALRRSLEAELRARMHVAGSEAAAHDGSTADLQAMLDRATDGAVMLDPAGRILSLNEPAQRLFGYGQNEIAGESLLMLLAPQSHPETTARLESLSQGGEVEAFRPLQVIGRNRDGASIPLSMTLARIGPSEVPQFCALVRDLSRDREAERRLIAARDAALAASAAKTDFLAHVSHEIRTPLHAILGFAEVMLEERFGPVGNERYKDYLKDIHMSGSHVMSLADDLLDLSKIEAGKLELAFAAVDANSVIRECVSLMQPQAARERVIMRISLHDRLPRVMVDERSLKQIMLNLMSNAVKFNEPGGQVIVSTAVDTAGQAVIRVRDTGVGMNENEVGLALTPFSQVGKAGAKGGAGLGLPLTKALVEANKAEFSIKSRREQGTLIEIAFPNIQAAQ